MANCQCSGEIQMYNKKIKLEDEKELVLFVSCFFWLIMMFVIIVSSESYNRHIAHLGLNELAAREFLFMNNYGT
ncbi:uncharacterized protein Bfra_008166 [Botrytis fragariae]|uniref:Uncharacterized protein n=1 Tax=Botrytis fragariae TaxID=1964551 RepID=A0A8H6ASL3_9HELO|nr:uncharacterized protein Bfra_008166 [Botrytis fragariae]KAF5872889.1 hypothetical protein Bfra_008166 [Botrytis fragariae]